MRRALSGALAVVLLVPATAAAHPGEPLGGHGALNPQGAGAKVLGHEIRSLLILGGAVYLLVLALLAAIVVRQRRLHDAEEPEASEARAQRWIWLGGLALPLVVISGVLAISASTLTALGRPGQAGHRIIEVVGHRWWWEFRYEDDALRTANEIAIPVGETVTMRLRTKDVIHSFWVPELTRKVDMTPGKVSSVDITAERPGFFRGECAEFCGLQHARMTLRVLALEPGEFESWRRAQRNPAAQATAASTRAGMGVFLGSTCAACHTIEGTPADGQIGPDLTHIASRRTLAGGTLENNRGNLAGWISDPQGIKRGAQMPPSRLSGPDLQALLDYLESLK